MCEDEIMFIDDESRAEGQSLLNERLGCSMGTVTKDMVSAGTEILWDFDKNFDSPFELVTQIYLAMEKELHASQKT